ncbi:hypothetical protein CR513_28770, partial [Mucuna pruriens]
MNEVGTIDNPRLENQLTELTSLVRQLAIGQYQPITVVKAYGICTSVEHATDMYCILQEIEPDHLESVGSIGGYQYRKQLYANRPFEGQQFGRPPYRSSPNQGSYAAQGFSSNRSMPQSQGAIVPTTTAVENATTSNLQFQQNMSATVQDLKTQVGQLAASVSQLESVGSKNLPSQTIPNPRRNASVKLRSTSTESKLDADSQAPQQARPVPVPFPG